MAKDGPILLIEDDNDDRNIFEIVVSELGIKNKIIWFNNTADAFQFLLINQQPLFLIFCDINLPGQDGLSFKNKIDDNPELRKKSIPFLFYSTSASQSDVDYAYTQMTVQGFFVKGNDFDKMKTLLKTIFDYWSECRHPNIQ